MGFIIFIPCESALILQKKNLLQEIKISVYANYINLKTLIQVVKSSKKNEDFQHY